MLEASAATSVTHHHLSELCRAEEASQQSRFNADVEPDWEQVNDKWKQRLESDLMAVFKVH